MTVIQVHNTRGGSAAQASRAQALVVGPSTPHTPCNFSPIMKAQATANLTLRLCSYPPPSVPRTSARPQPHPRRRTGGGEEPASRLSAPPSRTALRRTPSRGAPSPPAAPLPRRPSHPGPGIPQAQGAGHTTAERRAGRPCPPGSSSRSLAHSQRARKRRSNPPTRHHRPRARRRPLRQRSSRWRRSCRCRSHGWRNSKPAPLCLFPRNLE